MKVALVIIMALAIALLSGRKQPAPAGTTDNSTISALHKDSKSEGISVINESKKETGSLTTENDIKGSPTVVEILNNDTGLPLWSPSLWWNYSPDKKNKKGC